MILRYTCTRCGLVTRVEEGGEYRACVCLVGHRVEREEEDGKTTDLGEVNA